jgi:hypothetical protein
MKKGDMVTWESQSLGNWTRKTGKIIAVVPPYGDPLKYGYKPNGGPAGYGRNHKSYAVKVDKRTYWPRVSQLKVVS